MKEPRVYKTSPILLVFVGLLFIFFIGMLVLAFGATSFWIMGPFMIFFLFFFGWFFLMMASKTIVSDDEIAIQGLLGTKSINWMNLGRVSGQGYTLKLHSRDDDVTLSVSPRLPGYQEVVEFVGSKRPDLFTSQEYSSMKRSVFQYLGVLLGLFMMGGVAVAYLLAMFGNGDITSSSFMPLLILVVFALIMMVTTLSGPQSINLEGSTLNLKYLFSEKSFQANQIAHIQLSFTQSRNGRHYFIALTTLERKTIRISGLGLSLPIAYLVLKNWHRGQSVSAGTPTNIAPNWSDNTWR